MKKVDSNVATENLDDAIKTTKSNGRNGAAALPTSA